MAASMHCTAAGRSTCSTLSSFRPRMFTGFLTNATNSSGSTLGSASILSLQNLSCSRSRCCSATPATLKPAHSNRACLAPARALPVEAYSLAEGLETPLQLAYLATLLGILSVGAFLVVRQVLVRRELDEAAKALGERIRNGGASCEDYFELGVILTRKKLFTQATKNLEKAKKIWDGEESEKAQVHNALGFCYFNMNLSDLAIQEYRAAVELQPGYVTAWNNLGDVLEKENKLKDALEAYRTALSFAPGNKVALSRSEYLQARVERLLL